MKFILAVGTLILDSDSMATSESSAVYGNKEACAQAVEIRTGRTMNSVKNGLRLEITTKTRYGQATTVFVCAPYGE